MDEPEAGGDTGAGYNLADMVFIVPAEEGRFVERVVGVFADVARHPKCAWAFNVLCHSAALCRRLEYFESRRKEQDSFDQGWWSQLFCPDDKMDQVEGNELELDRIGRAGSKRCRAIA